MEALFTTLIIVDMIVFISPALVWALINFASHQGHFIDNKWKIIGLTTLISFVVFILLVCLTVYVGMTMDANAAMALI